MALSFDYVDRIVDHGDGGGDDAVALKDGLIYIRERFTGVNESYAPHLLLQFVSDFAHGFPHDLKQSLEIVREYRKQNSEDLKPPSPHLRIASEAITTAVYEKLKQMNMNIGWPLIETSIMLLTLAQKNESTNQLYLIEKMLFENKQQFKLLNRTRTKGMF